MDDVEAPASKDANARPGVRLFSGLKLWFSRTVPARDWLMHNAQLNGAEIVPLEKQADVLLVDHARKNQPPGTTSFKFITLSIDNGALEDPEDHAVGPAARVARPVGSVTTASKGGRVPYTEADDQFLWNVVEPLKRKGGHWQGNLIYQQIEAMNPRHSYQSWRDHFIKVTQFQNRQVTDALVLDPPSTQDKQASEVRSSTSRAPQEARSAKPARAALQTGSQPDQQRQQRGQQVVVGPHRRNLPRDQTRERISQPVQSSQPPEQSHISRIILPSERAQTPNQQDDLASTESPIFTPQDSKKPSRPTRSPVKLATPLPRGFTKVEAKSLYHGTEHIIELLSNQPEKYDKGWRGIEKSNMSKGHTAQEWKHFWESFVLPAYCERRGKTLADLVDLNLLGGAIEEIDDEAEEDQEVEPEVEVKGETQADIANESNRCPEEEQQRLAFSQEQPEHDETPLVNEAEVEETEAPSSPGDISCFTCFTVETRKWRRNKDGNFLCNDCGWFLKKTGILRPSNAWTELGDEPERQEENAAQLPTPVPARRQPPEPPSSTVGPAVTDLVPHRADAGVQTSPIIPPISPNKQRTRSPSFTPDSPSLNRPPAANEARKRSEGTSSKSNSQESNKPSNSVQKLEGTMTAVTVIEIPDDDEEEETEQNDQRRTRVRSPSTSEAAPPSRKKRRLQDNPNTLEIPPTPEHRLEESGGFDVANAQQPIDSMSPGPLKFPTLKSSTSHSPMFFPEDAEDDDDQQYLPSPSRKHGTSSQIYIDLFSGDDQFKGRSSHHGQKPPEEEAQSDTDAASQYAFETAPETTQAWETAPEQPAINEGQAKERVETQALWHIGHQHDGDMGTLGDDFALPDPEGGWEEIEAGYEQQDANNNAKEQDGDSSEDEDEAGLPELADIISGKVKGKGKAVASNSIRLAENQMVSEEAEDEEESDEETEDTSSEVVDLDSWRQHLARLHPPHTLPAAADLESISFDAIQATSFNFKLATTVVDRMLSQRSEHGPVVPSDISGCWTEEDDNLLLSEDEKDWERVVRKHGMYTCHGRFDFLEKWDSI